MTSELGSSDCCFDCKSCGLMIVVVLALVLGLEELVNRAAAAICVVLNATANGQTWKKTCRNCRICKADHQSASSDGGSIHP